MLPIHNFNPIEYHAAFSFPRYKCFTSLLQGYWQNKPTPPPPPSLWNLFVMKFIEVNNKDLILIRVNCKLHR